MIKKYFFALLIVSGTLLTAVDRPDRYKHCIDNKLGNSSYCAGWAPCWSCAGLQEGDDPDRYKYCIDSTHNKIGDAAYCARWAPCWSCAGLKKPADDRSR